ncbi:MAG TPA: DUF3459 domain-containing protein, partial [Acidimicrobiales bacterium]|nr:DUF3459 domain-containing protein [Acidimicrobiales bacterium]
VVLCSPCIPLLFMGEEWAASSPFPYFAGPRDPELDDAVQRGRAQEFGDFGWDPADIPDPIAMSTLDAARLQWDELRDGYHAEMLDWYRRVIALRRERPELSDPRPGATAVDELDSEAAMVMWRGDTAIAVNIGDHSLRLALDTAPDRRVLLASDAEARLVDGSIVLPAHSVAIVGR